MAWIDGELALIALAAMLSPTTLSFSTLSLVAGNRPLRTGFWFYVGALGATLAVGIAAALVLGDGAASQTSTPKTWVAILDVALAALIVAWVVRAARRPPDPAKQQAMVDRMSGLAIAPVAAVVGAGAVLANPGGFIPIALKDISELDPTRTQYAVAWVLFALVSLLPLAVGLLVLVVAPDRARRMLGHARDLLERYLRTLAFALLLVLAASLLRNGIVGLTS